MRGCVFEAASGRLGGGLDRDLGRSCRDSGSRGWQQSLRRMCTWKRQVASRSHALAQHMHPSRFHRSLDGGINER